MRKLHINKHEGIFALSVELSQPERCRKSRFIMDTTQLSRRKLGHVST